jgi:glycosyltransferase involved in cell wall biosynthesis
MRVSVLLPVMDETTALRQTVEILLRDNAAAIAEILIITSSRSSPAALAEAGRLWREHPDTVALMQQSRPFLGGALRDGFARASGTHVLMMASDLETDPELARQLIAAAAATGADIVTATRWAGEGGFEGYSALKLRLNRVFQWGCAALYATRLSDVTYGYRLFRTEWVKTIAWEELRHPFLLETALKPLRLGARVVEVPARWRARAEGVSHNPFWRNFAYLWLALRIRCRPRRRLRVAA